MERTGPRLLFIVKRKHDYNGIADSHIGLSSGLYNSCEAVVRMLHHAGVEAKLAVVVDNNDIDREVTAYQPTHVIIEALWVVPEKFAVLTKLHPDVDWVIRIHSELPFIAGESIAMDWIARYTDYPNVSVAVNSSVMAREIREYLRLRNNWSYFEAEEFVHYLPNFYHAKRKSKRIDYRKETVDIGCFGAIRPMKNHLMQAMAAIEFAETLGKKLRFHINSSRVEGNGGPVLVNLRALFEQMARRGHVLVEHPWMVRKDFIDLCETMDIGMQVSFSETFNLVGADMIIAGLPVVGSHEIPWLPDGAEPTDSQEIKRKLIRAYNCPRWLNWRAYRHLKKASAHSKIQWLNWLRGW